MNSSIFSSIWVQLAGLLALEVGLLALFLALLVRRQVSAVWRRTFCQAAIVAMLLLTLCEVSGAARLVARWARAAVSRSESMGSPSATPSVLAPAPNQPAEPASRSAVAPVEAVVPAVVAPALRSHGDTPRAGQGRSSAVPRHSLEAEKAAPAASHEFTVPASAYPLTSGSAAIEPAVSAREPEMATDSLAILWLGLVWAVGAALVAGRAGLARCLFMVLRLRRHAVANPSLLRQVETLGPVLGIRRRVRLLESPRLSAPIAFGWLRPTIGLPLDFSTRFDAAKREAMLVHELAHLAAHDPFWCLLADLASAILWWHPAAWWMRRQLHLAAELAADEACLLVDNGPSVLAECLVELGARLVHPVPGQLHMAGFRSHLGRRVQRLLHLEGRVWLPPRRREAALAKGLGSIALAAVVILCSAWFTPQTLMKGNCMKAMQQNWKRSLATFALLATFSSPDATVRAAEPGTPAVVPAATSPAPQPSVAAPAGGGSDQLTDDAFAKRYGMRPRPHGSSGTPVEAEAAKRGARIEAKLKKIVLPEIMVNNMPLGEVIKFLSDQSLKLDPEKQGINFLINPNAPPSPATRAATVDPSTGLPVPNAPPAEQIDMASVSINFNLPLRNVTLKDALDAIVKVAGMPIAYSVEDYAVIFSPQPELVSAPPAGGRAELSAEPLLVRTFKVNTNAFLAGLESVFGIKWDLPANADRGARSRKFQSAMRDLLTQLGISISPRKAIFYNDLTGMVMVRANPDDLETVNAAMELLGGNPVNDDGGGGGGGGAARPGFGSTGSAGSQPPGAR